MGRRLKEGVGLVLRLGGWRLSTGRMSRLPVSGWGLDIQPCAIYGESECGFVGNYDWLC